MRRTPLAFPVRVALVAPLLLLVACGGPSPALGACGAGASRTDKALPEFRGKLLDGTRVSLDSYRKGTVVLNVWGSWCGPCRKEAPELARTATATTGDGVRFLGVDVRDSRVAAKRFVAEFSVPFPSVFDEGSALAAGLGVAAPPATLVARDGRVRATILGATSERQLRCVLRQVA